MSTMPKSSQQQSLHCQQADDFTLVTAMSGRKSTQERANKENLSHAPNYQTLSQTIALERLQLLRMVELENAVFTLAFHLIESFYRPTAGCYLGASERVALQAKRKRRAKSVTDSLTEPHHTLGVFAMPRKRIHGLSKAYKVEYAAKMEQPGISKHFGAFHHELLDWQLVFAPTTDFPTTGTNLAKELNFDSLFDYEDAIATTANLLAIARQHSDLIDGLVLCPSANSKSILTEYIPDQASQGGSDEFRKLIALVEQLILLKRDRVAQLGNTDSGKPDNTGHLLANWFKCDKSVPDAKPLSEYCPQTQQTASVILKEISAWEELVDVVEISTK